MNSLLMLFLKEPVPGKVKTRLAAELGDEEACAIYRGFIERLPEKTTSDQWDTQVHFDGTENPLELRKLFSSNTIFIKQAGMDLGARMKNAFESNFKKGFKKITVIGGDSPDMPSSVLAASFSALDRYDAAVGPCEDGGYYLLGLTKTLPFIFEKISWGEETVLKHTLDRLKSRGKSCELLTPWYDVDTLSDYRRFMENNPHFTPHRRADFNR